MEKIIICKKCHKQFKLQQSLISRQVTSITCLECWKTPSKVTQIVPYRVQDYSKKNTSEQKSETKNIITEPKFKVGDYVFVKTHNYGVISCRVEEMDQFSNGQRFYSLKILDQDISHKKKHFTQYLREEAISYTETAAEVSRELVHI